MQYMQDAMQNATLNVFYIVAVWLFFVFSISIGWMVLDVLEASNPPTSLVDGNEEA